LPKAVLHVLAEGLSGIRPETPKPGDPVFDACTTMLVGTNYQALLEAERTAKELGYHTLLLGSRFSGEAREIGKVFSGIAQDILLHGIPLPVPACVIAGGETTVTLHGKGKGGRNQEMALSVLNEFVHWPVVLKPRLEKVLFLSGGTDGNDGPTDAAGAFADIQVLKNAQELRLDPGKFLIENDSYTFFERTQGHLITGPTGTNVCDIHLLLLSNNDYGAFTKKKLIEIINIKDEIVKENNNE
jgi:hydroxypyruvate reductase